MDRHALTASWNRLQTCLTLDGRIHVAQVWMLLPGPAALLLALIAPYRLLFYLAYVYLLLIALCYLWVRHVGPRVRLHRRQHSDWAQVGDELEELWSLMNTARLPLLWLEIADESTLPGYAGRRVVAADASDQSAWRTHALCERRGVYTLGPLTACLSDPLGLFSYQWRDDTARRIVIYPPLAQLPPLDLPPGQRGGLARADLLQQYATPSVGGLREYMPGDLLSHIHWPTVARTQRLMVKEFDQEHAGALWIALDLSAAAYDQAADDGRGVPVIPQRAAVGQTSVVSAPAAVHITDSPLELAIVLVGSLAAQALAEGRAVGLLANDGRQRLLTPARGPRQLWRILGELVDAQAAGGLPLGELLRQGYTAHATEIAGAAVVVVTPELSGAWLPALAIWLRGRPGGALALLIARHAAHAQPLVSRLATMGVAAHLFDVAMPLPLLNPPKPRTRLRVSPLGKIVREE